jgi:hypothetical protein
MTLSKREWEQIVYELDDEVRRKKLLCHIWSLAPGINDHAYRPCEGAMTELWSIFIESCHHTTVPQHIRKVARENKTQWIEEHPNEAYPKTHEDRPFDPEHTLATDTGRRWATVLCLAALELNVGLTEQDIGRARDALDEKVKLHIWNEVFSGYDDTWSGTMERCFEEARRLRDADEGKEVVPSSCRSAS